jgi:hypothetical protein
VRKGKASTPAARVDLGYYALRAVAGLALAHDAVLGAHGHAFRPTNGAALRLGGRDLATSPVRATDTAIAFTTTLTAGSHQLAPVFQTADGHEVGAYYAVVTSLP